MIKLTTKDKKDFVLTVRDKRYFRDIQITKEELLDLQKVLNKKFK